MRSNLPKIASQISFGIEGRLDHFSNFHDAMKPCILFCGGSFIIAFFCGVRDDFAATNKRNVLDAIFSKKTHHLQIEQSGLCILDPTTLNHVANREDRYPRGASSD